jgi:hypothetical protein
MDVQLALEIDVEVAIAEAGAKAAEEADHGTTPSRARAEWRQSVR